MTVAFSILTPVITSGLGPATEYGVNALTALLQHRTHYAFAHDYVVDIITSREVFNNNFL